MTVIKVFVITIAGALLGMLMGGLFGAGAGMMAPNLFQMTIYLEELGNPVKSATVLGSTVGVLLGGSLAVFGIIVELLSQQKNEAIEKRRETQFKE